MKYGSNQGRGRDPDRDGSDAYQDEALAEERLGRRQAETRTPPRKPLDVRRSERRRARRERNRPVLGRDRDNPEIEANEARVGESDRGRRTRE